MPKRKTSPHNEGIGNVEFRILGRLEAESDEGALDLGSFKQRSLLALLLIHRGEVVSTDRIIDDLWGSDAGADRQNTLWVHISNLRSALEPNRAKGSEGSIILTRAPGYVIPADAGSVDADRFEGLLREGRSLLGPDPAAAALVLGEALALWRGHPLEEFTYEAFAQTEIARLDEFRLEAVGTRIDADLARGLARELVGELEALVREHPTRERFAGQLMLALYRSGRQTDALRVYQLVSAGLAENLGLEPSTRLRRLEEQIVVSDPALDPSQTSPMPGDQGERGLTIRGYEVRDQLGEDTFGITYRGFQPAVGREVAIKVIQPEVANDPAFVRSFEKEAQLVARLEHPHIVPLYDYWREPGAAYLVMRLVGAGTVADRLGTCPMDHDSVARVVDHIGSALEYAHDNGVVHGDVRSANVLIDSSGNAYLADFGIAAGARSLAGQFSGSQPPLDSELSPAADVAGLARVAAQALTGQIGRVSELRVGLDPGIAQVLGDATDPAGGYDDVAAFTRALLGALDAVPEARTTSPSDTRNPYKGLRPFEQADSDDFFGRRRLVERLVARLGRPLRSGRFVAVVGPSGSGKSSLVKAGLLPALRANAAPASGEWFQVEMVPGRHPFESLEAAMLSVAVDPPQSLLQQLSGADGIRSAADVVLPDDHSQLLLVVDQLEELFTICAPDTAERFLSALAAAVTNEPSRVRVVATLRADFYDHPLRHRSFGELLRDGTEIITPMSPEELEEAITAPARRTGVSFEPALVLAMVTDAVEHRAALPLLQYALTEVFDHRRGSTIELATYREIGGVSGALAERAEGLYLALDERGKVASRQVFLRLVTIGEGGEDTRRRVLMSELRNLGGLGDAVQTMIDGYGRHRLLSFDRDPITRGPTVEVSHEALLHGWARLDGWIEDARSELRDQRRISEATSEWLASGRDDAYLLRGPQLDRLEASVAGASLSLSADESAFMAACVAERDRARSAEVARERQKQEAERRSRNRSRMLAVTAVVAVVVASLGLFAFYQRQQAKVAEARAATTAEGARIADLANRVEDPELSMLLALAATELLVASGEETAIQAEESMHLAIQQARIPYPVVDGPTGSVAGRSGVRGVYVLPIADLALTLRENVERTFTAEECQIFGLDDPCPPPPGSLATPLVTGDYSVDLSAIAPAIPVGPPGPNTAIDIIGTIDDLSGPDLDFEVFTSRTGTDVKYTWHEAIGDALAESVQSGSPPDMVLVPQPAAIAQYANEIGVIDIGAYLDRNVLVSDFGEYAMSHGTMAPDGTWPSSMGHTIAFPMKADLKALVWYPRGAFDAAGYAIPQTWDELISLSDQIRADGHTPWCVGWESGPGTGWPGTDWLEGLMLRTGTVDTYDQWVAHDIPFDNPNAMDAASALDQVIAEPGYVLGGTEVISRTWFGTADDPLYDADEPGCWLTYQASFMTGFAPPLKDPNSLGVFTLPPMERGGPAPVLSGSVYVVVLTDRPEVREIVRWMASPEFGRLWAGLDGGQFLSGNGRFDLANYGADQPLRRAMGEIVQQAWQTSDWRFDGSDLMPPPIGAFTDTFQPGSFWTGMIDYVDGVRPIEQVMHDIEADWVELEASGG